MVKKMSNDEFLMLVRSRRSCRKFKTDPIPDEYVEKILEAGRWAMSGANGQPWEFIVVKDQKTKDMLAEAFIINRDHVYNIERTRVEEVRMPAHRHEPTGPPTLQDAPVIIVVLGERRMTQSSVLYTSFGFGEGGPGAVFFKNMANTTQLMCLAAASLGLGAQWCSVSCLWEGYIKKILDIPEELTVHTMVPIGYPDYKSPPPYRRKLSEMVHYGKYDRSKFRSGKDIYDFLVKLRKKTQEAYSRGI